MAINLQKSLVLKKVFSPNYYVLSRLFNNNYYKNPGINNNVRLVSTIESKTLQKENGGIFTNLLKKIPFINLEATKIKASGYMLYEDIVDKIDYLCFFERFNLPDTFYSWFVITELHIWMLTARAMAEGDDGKILRAGMMEALWSDVGQRVKKLGAYNPGGTRHQIFEFHEQLQAAFISYDEGLQSDDIVLAGALWRRLYQMNYADPFSIERLVKYVRKQLVLLDNLPRDHVVRGKSISWEPITK